MTFVAYFFVIGCAYAYTHVFVKIQQWKCVNNSNTHYTNNNNLLLREYFEKMSVKKTLIQHMSY